MDIPDASAADAAQISPLSVRVKQACQLIGIGRSKLYELIAAGEIETIKVGAATLIPMSSLVRLLESRRGASS
jgi:excisionase family DNA binding protein